MKVINNIRLNNAYYLLTFHSPFIAKEALPGQFVMIRIGDSYSYHPFLRRPMSIHAVDKENGYVDILYKIVGRGTHILSETRSGDEIDIIGPFGRPFSIPPNVVVIIIVAGGIGIAPFLFLVQSILHKSPEKNIHLFFGGKTAGDIGAIERFRGLPINTYITTEDGSKGRKGFVTEYLEPFLMNGCYSSSAIIFSCGPNEMLKKVYDISKSYHLKSFVSLDRRMACGIGTCLGCVVETKDPDARYRCVCTDGPVFNGEVIRW